MQRLLLKSLARWQVARPKRRIGVSQRRSSGGSSSLHVLPRKSVYIYPVFQQRSFSTNDDGIHDEIERLTKSVLKHSDTPVGTMSASVMDDTITSCEYWCKLGSGYGIETADRLLRRLMYEHASGTSAALQYTAAIADLQLLVFKSWLSLGSSRLALEKANAILLDMVQWKKEGLSTHDPFSNAFMQECFPFPSVATKLLLLRTEKPDLSTAKELGPLFNTLLDSCVQDNDAQTATILAERMELLEKEYEWMNLEIDDNARKLIIEGPMAVPEESVEPSERKIKHLSSFEQQVIQERQLEFLKTATLDDKPEVLGMAAQLPTLAQSEVTGSLYRGCIDYFCKIQDAKNATLLLSRIDTDFEKSGVFTEKLFLDVLRLWIESQERDAPFRAQELVSRMEELDNAGILNVTTRTYNLLCESWVRSSDPSAANKVADILFHMEHGDPSKAPNLETYKLYLSVWPKEDYFEVGRVLSKLGEDLGKEELSNTIENALGSLAKDTPNATPIRNQERGAAALKLFLQAKSQGISVTPTMCINLMRPQPVDSIPKVLDYLESLTDVSIPFECYASTIFLLLDARTIFEEKKAIVSRTLKRYADGNLLAESTDIESLMTGIMQELAYQGRPSPMDAILKMFEKFKMMEGVPVEKVRIPPECYNMVLNGWMEEGDKYKFEETLNRMIKDDLASEACQTSLLPGVVSIPKVFQMLLMTNSPAERIARKATVILDDMLKRSKSSGDDAWKPNEACFEHTLTALSKVGSSEAAEKARDYLTKMIRILHCQPSTSAFNKVMLAIIKAPDTSFSGGDKYKRINTLWRRMKSMDVQPDVLTCKNMLTACSGVLRNDDTELIMSARSMTLQALKTIRAIGCADAGSYRLAAIAFISLLKDLAPDDRDKIASTVCRLCYEDGFLNERNFHLFRNTMRLPVWEELAEEFSTHTKHQPSLSECNKTMYAIVSAHGKAFEPGGKFTRVRAVMEKMQNANVEPDQATYKNILRACRFAATDDKPAALNLTMEAMGALRKSGRADAGAYGLLAKALPVLLRADKRDKVAMAACRFCVEDGLLTEQNREQFKSAMSKSAWSELREEIPGIEPKNDVVEKSEKEIVIT